DGRPVVQPKMSIKSGVEVFDTAGHVPDDEVRVVECGPEELSTSSCVQVALPSSSRPLACDRLKRLRSTRAFLVRKHGSVAASARPAFPRHLALRSSAQEVSV